MSEEYDLTEDSGEQSFDIRRILEAGRRQWVWVAIAASLALIPALVLPFRQPDFFEATATVAILEKPEVMQLGLDYMPAEPARIRSEAIRALASSDTVLGRVVDRLPASSEAPKPGPHGLLGWFRSWRSKPQLSAGQERQLRIESLRGKVTFNLVGGGTVLEVSAMSKHPVVAASLANSVADAFVGYKRSARDAALARATTWLSENMRELRKQIKHTEKAIAELVVQEGIDPSDAEDSDGDDPRGGLMDELRTARIELATVKHRLAALGPDPSTRDLGEAARERHARLQERHLRVLAELDTARLRYTPTHPEVTRLERTVASLASDLESLGEKPAGRDGASEYGDLQSREARLQARVTVLERALAAQSNQQASAPAMAAYERMERELAVDQQMLEVMIRRHDETMLTAATEHPDTQLLDEAIAPIVPTGPDRSKLLAVGTGLALSFGFGIGLLREMLDRRVRDPEEAAELLGVPSLGMIPRTPGGELPGRERGEQFDSRAAESYRNLRTALLFSRQGTGAESKLGTLVVTSGVAGEGKTTLSGNLAESFAQTGWRVLLVDADLRRSRVHRMLGLERAPGLTEFLRNEVSLDEVVRKPCGFGFDVITAGEMPDNPSELLTHGNLDRVRPEARERYDLIVVDSPVLLSVPDALLLTSRADATLLVNKPGSLEKSAFAQIRRDLKRAGARVIGVVFTQVAPQDQYLYPRYLASPYTEPSRRRWFGALRAGGKAPRSG